MTAIEERGRRARMLACRAAERADALERRGGAGERAGRARLLRDALIERAAELRAAALQRA